MMEWLKDLLWQERYKSRYTQYFIFPRYLISGVGSAIFRLIKTTCKFFSCTLKNDYLIGIALGVLSAIVDNVPLVAASQGMYDLSTYPTDHPVGNFLH